MSKKSEIKFAKRHPHQSIEEWEIELNQYGEEGWKVIQIIIEEYQKYTAVLRKDIE